MYEEFTVLLVEQGARVAAEKSQSQTPSSRSTSRALSHPQLDSLELETKLGPLTGYSEVASRIWDKGQFWDFVDVQLMNLYMSAEKDTSTAEEKQDYIEE